VAGGPREGIAAALGRFLGGYAELAGLACQRLPSPASFPPHGHNNGAAVVAGDVAARLTARPVAWFTCERLNLPAAIKLAGASGRHRLAARLASCQLAFQLVQSHAAAQAAGHPRGGLNPALHQIPGPTDGVPNVTQGSNTGRGVPGYPAGPGHDTPCGSGGGSQRPAAGDRAHRRAGPPMSPPPGSIGPPAAPPPQSAAAGTAAWDLLRSRAIRALREHVSDHGRCAACGNAGWPCEQALLGEANLGLLDGAVPAARNRGPARGAGEPGFPWS
jgi:hypothetical protein